MQQINEDTGTSRPVQRRYVPNTSQQLSSISDMTQNKSAENIDLLPRIKGSDARVVCLREEHGLAAAFIRSLFSVLYEVYSSSAGPAVRCKCLRALLRMVYYANADLLKEVLKNQVVSSHIAGMMASSDLRIVVGALQMAEILMSKLPEVFGVHFRREGVMHQINQLADPSVPLGVSPPKSASSTRSETNSNTLSFNETQPLPSTSSSNVSQPSSSTTLNASNGNITIGSASNTPNILFTSTPEAHRLLTDNVREGDVRSPSPSQLRLSDVLKRKRTSKRSSGSSRSKSRHEEFSPSLMQDLFSKATSLGNSTPTSGSNRSRFAGATSKTSSFLASLNPARWARNMNTSGNERNYSKESLGSCLGKSISNSNLTAGNKEKARTWVREQAAKFIETYSGNELTGPPHPAMNVLSRLTTAIQKLDTLDNIDALKELRDILIESDISPFEVNHSGLIKAMLSFLASSESVVDRNQRLRNFLHIFVGCPLDWNNSEHLPNDWNPMYMSSLVNKLGGCVSQLEQFPVKVHDLPAGSGTGRGGTSALKFFNTHQLKVILFIFLK